MNEQEERGGKREREMGGKERGESESKADRGSERVRGKSDRLKEGGSSPPCAVCRVPCKKFWTGKPLRSGLAALHHSISFLPCLALVGNLPCLPAATATLHVSHSALLHSLYSPLPPGAPNPMKPFFAHSPSLPQLAQLFTSAN